MSGCDCEQVFVQGNSPRFDFYVYGELPCPPMNPGRPCDLSNVVLATWTCARSLTLPNAIFSKQLGNGLTIVDAAQGLVTVQLYENETQDLAGSYVHEIVFTDGDGNVFTLSSRADEPLNFFVRRRIAHAS